MAGMREGVRFLAGLERLDAVLAGGVGKGKVLRRVESTRAPAFGSHGHSGQWRTILSSDLAEQSYSRVECNLDIGDRLSRFDGQIGDACGRVARGADCQLHRARGHILENECAVVRRERALSLSA